MQERRINGLSQIIAAREISIRCGPIVRVPFDALPERRIGIRELSFAGNRSSEHKRTGVEGILRGDLEFFLRGQRFVIRKAWEGAVVRNKKENSLISRFGWMTGRDAFFLCTIMLRRVIGRGLLRIQRRGTQGSE